MTARTTRLFALVVAALLALTAPASARAPEGSEASEARIQLARQAFAVGDTDEAMRIYLEILEEEPGNERAFWGLARVYTSANMEEEALIPMLEERLLERPEDLQTAMELGQAYATVGDHARAHARWSIIFNREQADVSDFTDVGAIEIRHRMFEQALETYTAGRALFRSTSLFSQELTTIHTALGDFGSAIDECTNTVNHHGGAVQWATNRIELMIDEGAGRRLVLDRMDDITESEDASVEELGLAGSVYLVLDLPDRALATFLQADDEGGGRGEQLLEYAVILRDEGLVEQARSAYLMVVERHPGQSAAARAGIAAARLLAVGGDPAGAVDELMAVATAFDGSSRGAQALYEAATVQLDDLRDPEAAVATVSEMRSRFGERVRSLEEDATLIEIDAYMMQGRFGEAYERAGTLTHEGAREDILEQATFARGFASFLNHDYGTATEEFRAMVEANAASELVNDGLRLMLVIANAQEAEATGPVDLLADAYAALMAGNDELARELLSDLAAAGSGEAVEAEALLLLGASAASEERYGRAIEHYDRIITGIEAITPRVEAMMRKADILAFEMGRRSEAMEQYLAILEDLPDNILSGEARRKLDRLRRGEEVEG